MSFERGFFNILSYYPSALSYFFSNAPAWIKRALPDSAGVGYNPDVGKYLDTDDKINNVISRLETAYRSTILADRYQ